MKSFQNRSHVIRSLEPRKCVHGRCNLQYWKNDHKQTAQEHNFRQKKQCSETIPIKTQQEDPHTLMMKSLIQMNEDYFQDKLQVMNNGKPSKLKLKIPSRTGFTVYKKDYRKGKGNQAKSHQSVLNFRETKIKVDLFGGTTYRNQFTGRQNEEQHQKRKPEEHTDVQAPSFLESQYKHNFLNWGAGSHMPSMKPRPTPATTNLPFQPNTIYSSEFTAKKNRKKQNFKPNNSMALSINSNNSSSPLLYLTTNNVFFDKKNNSKQSNLKPKTHVLAIDPTNFKGKTQYQSEFKNSKASGNFQAMPKKPLLELQNLMLSL